MDYFGCRTQPSTDPMVGAAILVENSTTLIPHTFSSPYSSVFQPVKGFKIVPTGIVDASQVRNDRRNSRLIQQVSVCNVLGDRVAAPGAAANGNACCDATATINAKSNGILIDVKTTDRDTLGHIFDVLFVHNSRCNWCVQPPRSLGW